MYETRHVMAYLFSRIYADFLRIGQFCYKYITTIFYLQDKTAM